MPDISVCTAIYNVEKYIERFIFSLFNQTLEDADIEYIFVDDNSTDNSLNVLMDLVKKYPDKEPHVSIVRNNQNKGPGLTRYIAGSLATGNYIYFPDADDWLEPNMLEELYYTAIREKADLVVCQRINETKKGSDYIQRKINFTTNEWKKEILRLHEKVNKSLHVRLIKKELYAKAIQNYPLCRLTNFEDYLLSIKVHFYSQRTVGVNKWLYHYNTLNLSSITKKILAGDIESRIIVADNLSDFISKEFNEYEYLSLIAGFKLEVKRIFITHPQYWNPERWRQTWPEINSYKFIQHNGFRFYSYGFKIYLINRKMDKIGYFFCIHCFKRIKKWRNRCCRTWENWSDGQ